MAVLAAELVAQHGAARGVMVATEANILCRTLYEKAGFVALDGHWVARAGMLRPVPGHIRLG